MGPGGVNQMEDYFNVITLKKKNKVYSNTLCRNPGHNGNALKKLHRQTIPYAHHHIITQRHVTT